MAAWTGRYMQGGWGNPRGYGSGIQTGRTKQQRPNLFDMSGSQMPGGNEYSTGQMGPRGQRATTDMFNTNSSEPPMKDPYEPPMKDPYTTQPTQPAQQQPQQGQPQQQPGPGGLWAQGGNPFRWSQPGWMGNAGQEQWADPNFQGAVNAYSQMLPWYQMDQNSWQYAMDFNEAQRRWNDQFGWQQSNDRFSQDLANRQQQQAEWIAQQQQGNWDKQFGFDQEMGRGQLAQGNRELDIRDYYQRGQLDLGNREAEIRDRYQQGQLAQGNRELDIRDWYQRNQIDVATKQNQIDEMYKSGQLTNQQRELALAELTQRQNEAFRYAQMTQEGALARENYQNQQAIARMNAFGRTQTPNAKWIRSWG